jgi:hypothetical protein
MTAAAQCLIECALRRPFSRRCLIQAGPPWPFSRWRSLLGVSSRRRMALYSPLQPGDPARLGRYEVLGRLGQGGMGAAMRVPRRCTAQVYESDFEHDPPFIVSEYIKGRTLAAEGPCRCPCASGPVRQ